MVVAVWPDRVMEFWPEFLATSGGHEFVAGGVGGMAGVLAGHPLDTLRIRLQQPPPPVSPGITAARLGRRPPSAVALLRGIVRAEGPSALYRGMGAPLASVAFQYASPVPSGAVQVMPEKSFFGRRPPLPLCGKEIQMIVGEPVDFDLPSLNQEAATIPQDKSFERKGWPTIAPEGLDEAAQRWLCQKMSDKIWSAMEALRKTLLNSKQH